MKKTLFLMVLTAFCHFHSFSQNKAEAEIRRLEQLEITTVLKGDTSALLHIWAKEFVVNNPYGQIVIVPQIFGFMRQGKLDYGTVLRNVDRVTFVENIAVTMGTEIITPENNTPNAGKIVTRQYTHTWIRRDNSWRLVARQATIVSTK